MREAKAQFCQDSSLETIRNSIRQVYTGRQYLLPEIAARLSILMNSLRLSARELEVLESIARGRSNPEIGALLGISENTVKFHVANILIKFNASDRTSAVVTAIRQGIIQLESVSR